MTDGAILPGPKEATVASTHPIKRACENCGSTAWSHVTPTDRKGALTRVIVNAMGVLNFNPSAGTPVEIYACDGCGLLRLFAVQKPVL